MSGRTKHLCCDEIILYIGPALSDSKSGDRFRVCKMDSAYLSKSEFDGECFEMESLIYLGPWCMVTYGA